jgi:hypothetical protein
MEHAAVALEQAVTPASSFAGLLASLTAQPEPSASRKPEWNDDGLADDFAVLSYEGALRSKGRHGQAGTGADENGDAAASDSAAIRKPPCPERSPQWKHAQAPPIAPPLSITEVEEPPAHALPRNLKAASITIRLNKAECAQLRARAAESGMTVSAYLRSCTFEVESLRAQVKDALANLRPGSVAEKPATPVLRRSLLQRMTHVWSHSRAERQPASV